VSESQGIVANEAAGAMIWSEALRLLVRQEACRDTLRTHALALLSVSSIVAALFGSHVVPSHQLLGTSIAIVAALAFFAASVGLALVIVWPRRWTFAHSLRVELDKINNQELLEVFDLDYGWAFAFESWRATNQAKLGFLETCFMLACAATAAQVVAWGFALF